MGKINKRILSYLAGSVMMASGSQVMANTDATSMLEQFGLPYEVSNSNDHEAEYALALQRKLTLDTPIIHTNFVGSHNAYNSAINGIIYWPQQVIPIDSQLYEGIEWIELDVKTYQNYWDLITGDESDPVVCHGGFCDTPFYDDIPLDGVLEQISNWADAQEQNGSDRTAIIYIETNLDESGEYDILLKSLVGEIGADRIYTPEDYRNDFPEGEYFSHSAVDFPATELTRQHILNKGKRIALYFSGYDGGDYHEVMDYMFKNDGGLHSYRVWEQDGFPTSNDELDITGSDIIEYWQAGKSAVNLHNIWGNDGRMDVDARWSWNEGEPNDNNGEDCAELRTTYDHNRWNDQSCSDVQRVACKNSLTGDLYSKDMAVIEGQWAISQNAVAWSGGEQACQALGAGWHFDTPRNAMENLALGNIAYDAGESRIWLNYSDTLEEGVFKVGSYASEWLDRDNPGGSDSVVFGSGDWEHIELHHDEGNIFCEDGAVGFDARRISDGMAASETGQILLLNSWANGLVCIDTDNGGECDDYEVRFHFTDQACITNQPAATGSAVGSSAYDTYVWEFRDDNKLQFRHSNWGDTDYTWWGLEDGACLDYVGDGEFTVVDCKDVDHKFYFDSGKLQFKRDSWGGNWNPWGLSGGACYTYTGDGNFGSVACDSADAGWEYDSQGHLLWASNPWNLQGGACFGYKSNGDFEFTGCEEN